jgi:eukaryotic-like serine/threonine-protein kinase
MNIDQMIARIKGLIQYIEERIVLRNIVLAFLILIFGITIIMQLLKLYTRHNHDLGVPNFKGMTFAEARDAAHKRDLEVEVFDSVFMADLEKGTVAEQHPRAGFMVKKNRKIFLTMNAINPERVAAPNLVDLTIVQARAKIQAFGLRVGRISYEPDMGINTVLAQRLNGHSLIPGDSVVKGSKIDLVLGKGLSDEQAAAPDLIGLTIEAASLRASDRFLSIGAAVRDQSVVTDEDEMNAVIYKQKPESGITLPMGSSIDVWITIDSTKVTSFSHDVDSLQLN